MQGMIFLCSTTRTVANCKKVSNFVLSWDFFCDRHIFDESVLAFILEWKSGKFQKAQGEQHTRHFVL